MEILVHYNEKDEWFQVTQESTFSGVKHFGVAQNDDEGANFLCGWIPFWMAKHVVEPSTWIRWNTGRSYTAAGQRIAAMPYKDGVLMSDADRNIDYYLPDCKLDQQEIMRRYDYNDRTEHPDADWKIRQKLEMFARAQS